MVETNLMMNPAVSWIVLRALAVLGSFALGPFSGWAAPLTPAQLELLPPAAAHPVDFSREVRPILEAACAQCHARGKAQGGFGFEDRAALLRGGDSGAAVIPGRSAESRLIHLVAGVDPDNVMPQKGSRLKTHEIALLRAWIDQGAKWEDGLRLAKAQPLHLGLRRPELPPAGAGRDHPVDRILRPYFEARQVVPPAVVSDRLFVRRAYLDAIGLLPSPERLRQFVDDPAADKRVRLVRGLLADRRRYAEHWLSFWNDALRNDYAGPGYIDGGRRQITGWLLAALIANRPFDQFVRELVAPGPESEGFARGILWRGAVNASQTPEMQAAQNIAQVFLGVNLKCASCHDSFVDDWTLADAYGLAAMYAEKPLEMVHCDRPTGKIAEMKFLYPGLGRIDPTAPRPERLRQLAAMITSESNGQLSRTIVNRLWARFLGRGLVEPVDDMQAAPWHRDLLDWLAADLVDHGYDLKRTMEVILTSSAYQLPAVPGLEGGSAGFVFRGPLVRRMTAEQFLDALACVTGDWRPRPAPQAELTGTALAGLDPAVFSGETRAALVLNDPLAAALGRPNREQVVTSRPSAATTLQALELTNGQTLAAWFERGAQRLLAGVPQDGAHLADILHERALGRPASPAERTLAEELVGSPARREGVEDLLWAVAMLPEFQLIY